MAGVRQQAEARVPKLDEMRRHTPFVSSCHDKQVHHEGSGFIDSCLAFFKAIAMNCWVAYAVEDSET